MNKNFVKSIHSSQLESFSQKLILVNNQDIVQKPINKLDAHLNDVNFSQNALPHRAFSLFLFDKDYKLLLQKRSKLKVTFPLLWANTCCSHQLYNENDEQNKYIKSEYYVNQRIVEELNYQLNKSKLELIQKIIYKAKGDEQFSEYELDYIYFSKVEEQQPQINYNINEVDQIKWIAYNEFDEFILKNNEQLTPWFRLISKFQLKQWWKAYQNGDKSFIQPTVIQEFN